jgi:hypothetical protein
MFGFGKKVVPEKKIDFSAKFDFKSDMEPLLFIIQTEVSKVEFTMSLQEKAANKARLLNDEAIKNHATDILKAVLKTVSLEYRDCFLSKYISYDAQIMFISNIIMRRLIELSLDKNLRALK